MDSIRSAVLHARGAPDHELEGDAASIVRDFIKWEGDPNYGSLDDDGGIHHDRTYKEMSLSRRFPLTSEADLIGNVRLYRVDGSWDYSYRIAAALHLTHPLRRR